MNNSLFTGGFPGNHSTPSLSHSLSRSFSDASTSYSNKFLSVFRPTRKRSLDPIPIPGLDGIMSNSGVAKVFDLDPRLANKNKLQSRALPVEQKKPLSSGGKLGKFIAKLAGGGRGSFEEAGSGYMEEPFFQPKRDRKNKAEDKLPKHSNVFTGFPTPTPTDTAVTSARTSEYFPSRRTSPTRPNKRLGAKSRRTVSLPAKGVKYVAYSPMVSVMGNEGEDHGELTKMPSTSEPMPETYPGATAEEIEAYERAKRHAQELEAEGGTFPSSLTRTDFLGAGGPRRNSMPAHTSTYGMEGESVVGGRAISAQQQQQRVQSRDREMLSASSRTRRGNGDVNHSYRRRVELLSSLHPTRMSTEWEKRSSQDTSRTYRPRVESLSNPMKQKDNKTPKVKKDLSPIALKKIRNRPFSTVPIERLLQENQRPAPPQPDIPTSTSNRCQHLLPAISVHERDTPCRVGYGMLPAYSNSSGSSGTIHGQFNANMTPKLRNFRPDNSKLTTNACPCPGHRYKYRESELSVENSPTLTYISAPSKAHTYRHPLPPTPEVVTLGVGNEMPPSPPNSGGEDTSPRGEQNTTLGIRHWIHCFGNSRPRGCAASLLLHQDYFVS
jgi:hypothetical protein